MFSARVLKNLIELQKAVTPEATWKASNKLMRAAMPVKHVLMGLPSLEVQPIFLRTTVSIPDMEEFFARVAQLTPLKTVLMNNPGIKVARMSDAYEPKPGCPFYEECLKPNGWLYSAAMLFWKNDGSYLGQLSTVRTAEQGDYTDQEMALLLEIHPHVEAAIQRLQALERAGAASSGLEHSMQALPLPMAMLDWNLDVVYINRPGRDAATMWRHGPQASRQRNPTTELPEALRETCNQLKEDWIAALERGKLAEATSTASASHPGIPGLTARLQLLEPTGNHKLSPSFVISFSLPPAEDAEVRNAIQLLSLLTRTEQRVAVLASAGRDNDNIATELGISRHTVRAHLRNIFKKLCISSRAKLGPLHNVLEDRSLNH